MAIRLFLIASGISAWGVFIAVPNCRAQENADQYPHFEKETQPNIPTLHFAPPSSAPKDAIPIDWEGAAACGANCMYLLLNLEGHAATLNDLRAELPTTGRGASMADLAACAERHGLKMTVLELSPRELTSCRFPTIVRMGTEDKGEDAHYMVALRATKEGLVEAIDGTSAQQFVMPASIFNKHFTGYVLTPEISTWATFVKYVLVFTFFSEVAGIIYLLRRMIPKWR